MIDEIYDKIWIVQALCFSMNTYQSGQKSKISPTLQHLSGETAKTNHFKR